VRAGGRGLGLGNTAKASTDSSPQMSEIESIHDAEEDNYRIALKLLGDTSSLHEDFIELYRVIREISVRSKFAARDEIVTGLHLLL
jgi:hypothetical protein